MIERPHNYSGECIDCLERKKCRFGENCPLIDNYSRISSHYRKGLPVKQLLFGCIHYRDYKPEDVGDYDINEYEE